MRAPEPAPARILAGILAAFAPFMAAGAHAAPEATPRPAQPDCRSALRVGPVSCPDESPRARALRTAALERSVDAYLSNFGKPPREAVRALLDPSDANIEAWARQQQDLLTLAARVAARLTEAQARIAAQGGGPAGPAGPGSP